MRNRPNYFVLRATKRGNWQTKPFAGELPAFVAFQNAKPNAASVLWLEITVNPDASPPIVYNLKEEWHDQ